MTPTPLQKTFSVGRSSALLGALSLSAMTGCGTLDMIEPRTNYVARYEHTAFVPGPTAPQFTGEPMRQGTVDVAARAAIRSGGDPHVQTAGQAAVIVPKVDASAGFLAGATNWLAVGGELRVSNSGSSSESALATPHLPFGARSLFGLGPEIAIGTRFGEGNALFIGGSFSASLTRVAWASYTLDPRTRIYGESDEGQQFFVNTRFAALAGGRALSWLSIYTGAALSPQIVNIGFSNHPLPGSTLRIDGSTFMPLLGARVDLGHDPGIFMRAVATAPIGTRYVSFTPIGMDLAFGFRVE